MSYGDTHAMIAADAQADARATFIKKTYAHLAGAILVFTALEYFLVTLPGIENVIAPMVSSRFGWLIVLGLFMGVSYVAEMWARSSTSKGMQYAGLGLYVAAEAVIFLPLIYVAAHMTDPSVLPTAGILTLAVSGGLTAAVLVTGKDYSFLGPILAVAGFVAMGFILAACIFGFSLGLIFSFVMVAFASAAILYQTSNVLHHYNTDQYVAAALALFAAVALLFWYVLRIVMATRD